MSNILLKSLSRQVQSLETENYNLKNLLREIKPLVQGIKNDRGERDKVLITADSILVKLQRYELT